MDKEGNLRVDFERRRDVILLLTYNDSLTAQPCNDIYTFKFLPYQLSMVG